MAENSEIRTLSNEKQIEAQSQEDEISILDILMIVKKHWIMLVACIVVALGAGVVFDMTRTPTYQSKATMIVSYDKNDNTTISTSYNFSNYITDTYVDFIKDNKVLNEAAENLITDQVYTAYTSETVTSLRSFLNSNLSVSAENLIVSLSFTDSDPVRSNKALTYICNAAVSVADLTEADGTPVFRFLNGNIAILSYPENGSKVSNTVRNVLIFAAIGLVVAVIYMFIVEFFNTSFKNEDEIEQVCGVTILSTIPWYVFDDEEKTIKVQPQIPDVSGKATSNQRKSTKKTQEEK